MNKAVLLSVNPGPCALMVDGKKLMEIRKNKPNLDVPFKCYIYCTIGDRRWRSTQPAEAVFFGNGNECSNGKVIGEFICDGIVPIHVFEGGAIQNWNFYNLPTACVDYDAMTEYIGPGKTGYGWHISKLAIYDQPKPLSELAQRAPQSWCYVKEEA